MKSKTNIGLEQIFDNNLLFVLFEWVNLMNIWYTFTTLGVTSPGGQWDEGHGVVHLVQGEYSQSSFLDHYKIANL